MSCSALAQKRILPIDSRMKFGCFPRSPSLSFRHSLPPDPVSGLNKEMIFPVEDAGAAYHFTRYPKFLDPNGYPAVVPPWGTLNALDLNTGKCLWKIPLGEYLELVAQGGRNTGE